MGEWKKGTKLYPDYLLTIFCKKNESFDEEFGQECLQLVLIKKGTIVIETNGIKRVNTAPCVLCFNSRDVFSVISHNTFEADSIYFLPQIVNNSLDMDLIYSTDNDGQRLTTAFQDRFFFKSFIERSESYAGCINADPFMMQMLCQKFAKLKNELETERDYFWPCRSRSIFIEMLIAIQEKYISPAVDTTDIVLSDDADDSSELSDTESVAEIVLDYLHTNYMNKITISDLTKQFPVNRNKLNRQFAKLTGMTPIAYLLMYRLKIAEKMLTNTTIPIYEISERVGFGDQVNLIRNFEKTYRETPTSFRKQYCILSTI